MHPEVNTKRHASLRMSHQHAAVTYIRPVGQNYSRGRLVLLYVAWRNKMEPMSLALRGMEGEAERRERQTRENHHWDRVEAREWA